jgi:signal transduction histidine kinase
VKSRGETTRLTAARLLITAMTVSVGIFTVFGLVAVGIKMATTAGYQPKALYNTMLSISMIISGLLVLWKIRTSLQRGMVFYALFNMAMVAVMYALDHRLYVELGRDPNVSSVLYVPHIGVLMVALIVGLKAALVTAGGGVVYLIFLSQFTPDPTSVGTPIIIVLALPFTALLVERLLDEVEREAQRAHLAEISLSAMAHDLGNPLTVLSISLELLDRKGEMPPEQRETLLRTIRRNTRTLQHLLDEFREIPRLNEAVSMERVNLHSIVHDVVELYARPMCDRDNQTLHANLQPVKVFGAPSRLGRMTRELLTNAMKYTPPGGQIKVTLQAGEWAILRVSNSGWGIKKEELAHIFDQNWRGSTVSQQGVSGTGLGLYICKNIVENHGGRIEAESEEGKDTSFTIYLSLPKTAATHSPTEVNSVRKETGSQ